MLRNNIEPNNALHRTAHKVRRPVNADVRDKKMKVSRGTLTALHVTMHGVIVVGLASVYLKGINLIPIILAMFYFLGAPPLFFATKKKMDGNGEASSFPMFFSQLALILFWILSVCLLTISALYAVAILKSGIGPQD